MPIEIRELIIKAEVTETSNSDARVTADQSIGSKERTYIIEECVERVLEMIKRQNQR